MTIKLRFNEENSKKVYCWYKSSKRPVLNVTVSSTPDNKANETSTKSGKSPSSLNKSFIQSKTKSNETPVPINNIQQTPSKELIKNKLQCELIEKLCKRRVTKEEQVKLYFDPRQIKTRSRAKEFKLKQNFIPSINPKSREIGKKVN